MRIAIDATSLLGDRTGVGTFTRHLVDGLAASLEPDDDLRLFAVSWRGRSSLTSEAPRRSTVSNRRFPARLARMCWTRFPVPSARWFAGEIDLVHSPNFVVPPGGRGRGGNRVREVVTIHDLTCLHYPEMCTPDTLAYPRLIRAALRRGASVHAVSRFVADEVLEAFDLTTDRVVVVPNGVDLPTRPSDPKAGRRIAGVEQYVLALGTIEPRKDLPLLVRAFDQIASAHPSLHLVVAGPDGWGVHAFDEAVHASPHHARIRRLGWLPDGDRRALLAGATVLAFPSRYEGFGLPPLEAMAEGTPVVATAAGAVPQVVGDAALLVPVGDHDALAAALTTVIDDPAQADLLRRAGLVQASAFPWTTTVAGIRGLYHSLLA